MPVTKGTSHVVLRNVQQIRISALQGATLIFATMLGENIEQGVSVVTSSGTSKVVANGAKVSTSEKMMMSWTLIGPSLAAMETPYMFSSTQAGIYGYTISSILITLTDGKKIEVLKPVMNCSRQIKVGEMIKFVFTIEKNEDDIDSVVKYYNAPAQGGSVTT